MTPTPDAFLPPVIAALGPSSELLSTSLTASSQPKAAGKQVCL